ncbi:MAG TPA: hypothetical protein VJ805_10015 [Nitrospiraceae bacterium]|nr:hypothetical protein [Nitrospiraceae bacterium]
MITKRRASQYTPLNQFLTSLGLEYRLFKHFGVGGAVNGLDVDVESPVGKSATFTVDNSWNTAFVYGSLYF